MADNEQIRIVNTQSRALIIPARHEREGTQLVTKAGPLRLIPGGQDVDLDLFVKHVEIEEDGSYRFKNATVEAWRKSGKIKLSEDNVGREPGVEAAPDNLSGYNTEQAEALIELTNDREVLERWKASEERVGVSKALTSKLAALAA